MLHKEVTIVREVNGIGITSNLIGYHFDGTIQPVEDNDLKWIKSNCSDSLE